MRKNNFVFLALSLFVCGPLFSQKVELILPVGHQREITKAIFSPDQKLIYTASADNSISVWDAFTGNEIRKLRGHTAAVNDIAISSNGKFLVSASEEGKTLLWNTANGKVLHMLPQNYIPVKHVCISPMTNFVVTGAYSDELNKSVISFWTLPNGTESKTIEYENEKILGIAISMHKQEIMVITDKGILYEIDGNTFEQKSHDIKIKSALACFDEDANSVAFLVADQISVYSTDTYQKSSSFASAINGQVTTIQFSKNINEIILGSNTGNVFLVDGNNGAIKTNFNGHSKAVNSVQISTDKKYILTASSDNTSCLFEASTGLFLRRLEGKSIAVNDFSLLQSDQRILSLFGDSSLKEWKIADRISIERILNFDTEQQQLDVDDEGIKMVSSGFSKGKIIDGNAKKILSSLPGPVQIKNAVISPDGKWIAYLDMEGNIGVSHNPAFTFTNFGIAMKISAFSDLSIDRNNNLLISEKENLKLYNLESGKILKTFSVKPEMIKAFAYAQNLKYYAIATSQDLIKVFSPDTDTALFKIDIPVEYRKADNIKMAFSNDGNYFAFSAPDNLIHLVETSKHKTIQNFYGHTDAITNIRFTGDGNFLMSSSMDHTIRLWMVKLKEEDAKIISYVTSENFSYSSVVLSKYDPTAFNAWNTTPSQFEQASFIALKNDDWIIITPDRYYFCNKGAAKELGYNKNGKYFSFEQFDLKYNRPDIVLKRIGINDSTLIDAYKKAYEKRLRKMGFTEDQLNDDLNLPEIKIKNFEFLPGVTDSENINFNIEMKDEKYALNRMNCWVNGIALFGKNGMNLTDQNIKIMQKNIRVGLTAGINNIRFSVLNAKGAESYKATANIEYKPVIKPKPNLYIIAISVSEYADASMNLRYSVKDGRDLVRTLSSQKMFSNIILDTFYNKAVTKNIMASLKQKLRNTTTNDEVILFVSGHGMLDKNLDFYFATHDMDFSKPEKNGISYDALEDILDSIPARKKLMLMDACHSGELDKDENFQIKNKTVAEPMATNVSAYEARGSQLIEGDSKIGLQNSFEMMQELFAGINKGSGTVVISAAAGKGFAFESPKWNNGVFTYSIMNGIASKDADKNKDNKITAKELLDYVSSEVERLTNGAQKPTSRKENFEFDWVLWTY